MAHGIPGKHRTILDPNLRAVYRDENPTETREAQHPLLRKYKRNQQSCRCLQKRLRKCLSSFVYHN